MQEYTCFFESAAAMEEEKRKALLSDNLHRIERALTEHQRIAKEIEQYEKRRMELQERLGIGGKTFREIISLEQGDHRQQLKQLFAVFSAAIQNIKHSNARSLDIARLNLKILEEMHPVGVTDAHCYDHNGTSVEFSGRSASVLNTKA